MGRSEGIRTTLQPVFCIRVRKDSIYVQLDKTITQKCVHFFLIRLNPLGRTNSTKQEAIFVQSSGVARNFWKEGLLELWVNFHVISSIEWLIQNLGREMLHPFLTTRLIQNMQYNFVLILRVHWRLRKSCENIVCCNLIFIQNWFIKRFVWIFFESHSNDLFCSYQVDECERECNTIFYTKKQNHRKC